MIFAVIGLPGPMTLWCREVTAQLLKAVGLEVTQVHGTGSLADVGRQMVLAEHDHLVISINRPDNDLAEALRQANRPILHALSDPRRALLHLTEDGGLDALTAIRALSGDCSCLIGLAGHQSVVPIGSDSILSAPQDAIRRIAQINNLPVSRDDIARIAEDTWPLLELMAAPEKDGHALSDVLRDSLGEGVARAGEFLLGSLERHLTGHRDGPLIATKELFLCGDPPHGPVTAPLDMTGRSRYIAFGPYIHIPSGTWLLRYVISFSEEAVGVPCIVDVIASDTAGIQELTRSHVVVSTPGRMDITLAFQNNDPLAALQVRLLTEKPIFDGKLAVGFAEFRLKTDDTNDPDILLP